MKIRKTFLTFALLAFTSTFFVSCDGDENESFQKIETVDIEVASDDSYTDGIIDEAGNYADDAFKYGPENGGKTTMDSTRFCATISHDTTANLLTLNFGTEGCVGRDGKTRTGVIEVSYTGKFVRDHRGSRTITFKSFGVNGNKVNGTVNYSATTYNDSEKSLSSTTTASNLVFDFTDETTFTLTARNMNRKLFIEAGTIEIFGTSNGVNRFGKTFSTSIDSSSPLQFGLGCLLIGNPNPWSGIKTLNRQDKPAITINFGDGECDRKAVISNGTNSREIVLRR